MNLINTYLEGSMTYSFLETDTEDGEYTEIISNKNVPVTEEAEDKVLVSGMTIPAGTKKYYKLVINLNYTDFDQTADLQAKLETQFKITEGILKDPTPAEKTLAKLGKTIKEGTPAFGSAATSDETKDGLYTIEDDYGTSYYYRGATEDNYVKFAGFYWRIVRINGDGSLRILYDGTSPHPNGEDSEDRFALTNTSFNNNAGDAKYVGYMYGPSGTAESTSKEQAQTNLENSTIKTLLENWYKTNITDRGFDSYVSDNIFCNDRYIPPKSLIGSSTNTEKGYGKNITLYATISRYRHGENLVAIEDPSPKIKCTNKNDAFTKNDVINGNGQLQEKVGLLTGDEVVLVGSGKWELSNNNYFLKKGKHKFWTMSPTSYYAGGLANVFYVSETGQLINDTVSFKEGIVPVISLTSNYVKTLIGNGTMNDPFREENLEP